jgi:hypothetical protein
MISQQPMAVGDVAGNVSGPDEAAVLGTASRAATLDVVPPGSFARVTDDQAGEFRRGRWVELPLS